MKVAITGGNGFLTRYLVAQLKELGSTPVLFSRNSGQVWDIPFAVTDYSEVSPCEIFNKSGEVLMP